MNFSKSIYAIAQIRKNESEAKGFDRFFKAAGKNRYSNLQMQTFVGNLKIITHEYSQSV